MPRYDQEKMVKLTSELRKSQARLAALSALPRDVFLGDPDKIGSAKYHFVVAIEICIDLCSHIISRNGYRVPDDYADTFTVMREAGAFDERFAGELRDMARFRNRLVHLYWEVDDAQVHELLQTRRGDFKRFLDALAVFLEWQTLPGS
jgi:uncharacterized protein YutE (UPF0331/DUF86 family)